MTNSNREINLKSVVALTLFCSRGDFLTDLTESAFPPSLWQCARTNTPTYRRFFPSASHWRTWNGNRPIRFQKHLSTLGLILLVAVRSHSSYTIADSCSERRRVAFTKHAGACRMVDRHFCLFLHSRFSADPSSLFASCFGWFQFPSSC